MKGFGNPTREERLQQIAANLARVYSPDLVKVPAEMKERVRRLKEEPAPKPRPEVSPG